MSTPADRAANALLAHAPLGAATVRGLLALDPGLVYPLSHNARLREDAWCMLYGPKLHARLAAQLVDRPLSEGQVRHVLVDRDERRAWPVVTLLRSGGRPVPSAVLAELASGPRSVRATLAVLPWVPQEVARAAGESVPEWLIRPISAESSSHLEGKWSTRCTLTDEEYLLAASTPASALALLPWRVQRAAADMVAERCPDAAAWFTLLRMLPTFSSPLDVLLHTLGAIAA